MSIAIVRRVDFLLSVFNCSFVHTAFHCTESGQADICNELSDKRHTLLRKFRLTVA